MRALAHTMPLSKLLLFVFLSNVKYPRCLADNFNSVLFGNIEGVTYGWVGRFPFPGAVYLRRI